MMLKIVPSRSVCRSVQVSVGLFRELSVSSLVSDRSRQPTGRAGMPSPWLRTPFFHERGPPAGVDKSLQERLDELYRSNPVRAERVDIGFAPAQSKSTEKMRISEWRRKTRANKELEKAAREGTLSVDLSIVKSHWIQSGAVFDEIQQAGDLYGVFEDLFGQAYYKPCVMMDIAFRNDKFLVPVHRGNMIKPREATSPPSVQFSSGDSESLWCLVMTGLDSHFTSEHDQYLHWMVANIRGSDLSSGQEICKYLQPFPPYGTGYHRYSFVLYRQEQQIDFAGETVVEQEDKYDLEARSFKMLDFYSKYQDQITPAGLAFFQSDYDTSLRDFFHHKLDMQEPRYEYEFPDWYLAPWMFHLNTNKKDGFDEFLDKHRDPKDLEREVLELKLSHTDPYEGDTNAYMKYPGVHDDDLLEQFPPPPGEKRLNPKQSYKIAQWRRNAVMKQRLKERYFRSTDHRDLRRDPSMNS